MHKYRLRLFVIAIALLLGSKVLAGSFYSSRGLGELKFMSNAQAIGMGYCLIAVPDFYQINVLNPAALVFTPITRLSGDFIHEGIWNQDRQADGFVKYTNLNGMAFAVPLQTQKLVTAISLIPASQFDYEYREPGSINDFEFVKQLRAKGGLNKISFGFGLAMARDIYLGSNLNVNFGKFEQTWLVDYVSDLFWDSYNRLTRKMHGLNWTIGIVFQPAPQLYLGGIFSNPYRLKYSDEIINYTQKSSSMYKVDQFASEERSVKVPKMWGVGISYKLKDKMLFSSDFSLQPWSEFMTDQRLSSEYRDSYRWGLGIERLPSKNMIASYYDRMTYRAGFSYQQLNFKTDGQPVSEYGFSLGVGLPYSEGWGRMDIALRYARRGDLSINPVEEDIFQLVISVATGEKWFVRRQ